MPTPCPLLIASALVTALIITIHLILNVVPGPAFPTTLTVAGVSECADATWYLII